MKPLPRKIITPVIVFLLLGAIVNVAVAWGCALSQPQSQRMVGLCTWEVDGEKYWAMLSENRFCRRVWIREAKRAEPFWLLIFDSGDTPICDRASLPSWSVSHRDDIARELSNDGSVEERAVGWPLLALRCRTIGDPYQPVVSFYGGLGVSRTILAYESTRVVYSHRALPYFLNWPGFAINTVFYAAVLWVLFAAPGWIRRRIRARRGLCPACAYPVGTNPICTECGAALPLPQGEGRGEGEVTVDRGLSPFLRR